MGWKSPLLLALVFAVQICLAGKIEQPRMAAIHPQQMAAMHGGFRQMASSDEDSIIFYANFDTATAVNNWSSVDLTDPGPTWHKDAYNAYSGQSWWSGKTSLSGYDNNWLQYLITPVIDLSGASNPVLTCSLYWAVEEPSYFQNYDGWDGCNVWVSANAGYSWQVLEPEYPAYTCRNLYGFGWLWGMSPDSIAGWAGFSGGWTSARFDLSYFTAPDIRLRFAFCSDAATCTADDPSLLGFFLDNIAVKDGPIVYLQNNGEGGAYPSEFTTDTGEPRGNFWVISSTNYHSSSHSWNCDDRYFLSDALVSPPISIPANMGTEMSYWVYCLMPDFNGDNDQFLDDYYYIEVAPFNSAIWTPLVYDYAVNGSQFAWVERTNGVWNGFRTNNINLTPWAGQSVRIRFRVVTDGNNDGGDGTGLFIDDVTLTSHALPNNDVGATNLIVPFPTFQGQGPITCTVGLANYGILNQPQVPAFWSVNGMTTSLIPWSQVAPADTVFRTFTWTPPASGLFDFKAFTQLTVDQDHSNDTAYAGLVDVTPQGFFELGYDHRQLTYLPDFYYFNFSQGIGPMVHFTPAADGIPGILYGNTIKGMFYSAGTLNLHIYADGPGGALGTEVYNAAVTIPPESLYPDAWAEMDISDVSYLQGGHPNFWVWLEITSQDYTPHITGHLLDAYTTGHFFTYDGSQSPDPSPINFNIRATLTGSAGVEGEDPALPCALSLSPNYPNPFNSQTSVVFSLPKPSRIKLSIYDLLGRQIRLLASGLYSAGTHRLNFDVGDLPSAIYICRLEADGAFLQNKLVLLK